jgi:hypothetical protein
MAVDFRAFLGRSEELALPWLGGDTVATADRALRLRERPARRGWWRFRVEGRWATPLEPAAPPDAALGGLERASGHLCHAGRRLVLAGAIAEPLELGPEEQPPRFAPCRARRWHSGELLFEELLFESEAEELARRAFEDGRSLADAPAVPATLRAAFGYELVAAAAAAEGVAVAPLEVRRRVLEIALGGHARAHELVRAIAVERERVQAERVHRIAHAARAAEVGAERERVEEALRGSGAALLDLRRLGPELAEVRWRFLGERFVTLVEPRSLRVVDAGICLAGADASVALASLPGVVREACEEGELMITAREEWD